jgi:hypothetical protein
MEEAVRVRHDARRRQRDHLIQTGGNRLHRQLRDEALIDVGVRCGIALDEIFRVSDNVHGGGRARESEGHLDLDGDCAPYFDVLGIWCKALCGDRHMIRVGRKVAEDEPPGRVGRRGTPQSRQRVAQLDGDGGHDATSWILHRSLDGAGAAEFLAPSGPGHEDDNNGEDQYPCERTPPALHPAHKASLPQSNAVKRGR